MYDKVERIPDNFTFIEKIPLRGIFLIQAHMQL